MQGVAQFGHGAAMRILFGWELGAGMGHLKCHLELFTALRERGHDLHVASRDVAKAALAFQSLNLPIWQAPFGTEKPEPLYPVTPTMAQVLHNSGLTRIDNVLARTQAWDLLIQAIRPELVLLDSAPTLLLALRGKNLPVASLSTGFFVPPEVHPLPRYSVFQNKTLPPGVPTSDTVTLAALNAVLAARKQPPLPSIAALYNQDVLPLLTTLPELDHFLERKNGHYVGLPSSPPGATPEWPDIPGPRIYAYLKPFKTVESVLAQLRDSGMPTIIVSDGIPEELRRRYSCQSLKFSKRALDLNQVTETCRIGISNANHGTLAHFLLRGIPVLLIPLFLEQEILASNVVKHNTGLSTSIHDVSKLNAALRRLLEDPAYGKAAQEFAARHAGLAQPSHIQLILERLRGLVPV